MYYHSWATRNSSHEARNIAIFENVLNMRILLDKANVQDNTTQFTALLRVISARLPDMRYGYAGSAQGVRGWAVESESVQSSSHESPSMLIMGKDALMPMRRTPSPVSLQRTPSPIPLQRSPSPPSPSPSSTLSFTRGNTWRPPTISSPAASPTLKQLMTSSVLQAGSPTYLPSLQISDKYNFDDWNVEFEVEGTLYRVHRYFFKRESAVFARSFDCSPAGQPISPSGISRVEFDALLELMYFSAFEFEPIGVEKWMTILRISNKWSMTRIRELSVIHIEALTAGITPVDKIVLAAEEEVQGWILPAYIKLVERDEPLSIEEARKFISLGEKAVGPVVGMDIVPLIAQARERFRSIHFPEVRVVHTKGIVMEVFGYPTPPSRSPSRASARSTVSSS